MTIQQKAPEGHPANEKAVKALTEALAAPFTAEALHFKPGKITGNRALALVYVDARAIQDRLDAVLGVQGWQDEYECLPDGSVVCRLRLRLGQEWITKMDVGAPSEQPDEGDRRKAAFSDALKRAAVKFGIGRYLYRVGPIWADFDPQTRKFVRTPVLPNGLQPRSQQLPIGLKERTNGATKPADSARPAGPKHALPTNGVELQQRLNAYDSQLAGKGLCKPGDLVKFVVAEAIKAGHGPDLASWTPAAINLAVEETKVFEGKLRHRPAAKKEVA